MLKLSGLSAGLLVAAASSGALTAVVYAPPWADTKSDCRQGQNNPELAIAACTQLIDRNPRDIDALWSRGGAHEAKNDYDRAIADYTNRGGAYSAKGESWVEAPTAIVPAECKTSGRITARGRVHTNDPNDLLFHGLNATSVRCH